MMDAIDAAALCKARFRSLGREAVRIEKKEGPFAAALFDVWVEAGDGAAERYIYKLPPRERNGEFEILGALGAELSPWLPDRIVRFEEAPKAIVMRYAGEPLLPAGAVDGVPEPARIEAYELVTERLAELHLRTAPHAERWAREGRAAPYRYAREWADDLLAIAEGALGREAARKLGAIANAFYAGYSAASMRGPTAFTHGDPHWGNALRLGDRITLIDWEWTNVASPMRDIAILVQDEPNGDLLAHIAESYARRLLRGGFPGAFEALSADFDRMMVDNAIMTLGWDVALYRRGDLELGRLLETADRRLAWIEEFWKRVRG